MEGFEHCPDKVLFEVIASGNEAAFQVLFNRYKASIYASAYKWTRSHHASEEITQEVFIRLWVSRNSLLQVEEPAAYIYRMISNKIKDYLQADLNREKILQQARRQQTGSSNITEETIALNTSRRLITEAIGQLTCQKRNIYCMNRQEGKSVKEIASELHLSPNTVKTHLYEAIRTIRSYLKNAVVILLFILSAYFS